MESLHLPAIPEQLNSKRLILRTPRQGDGLAVYQAVCETLTELRRFPASLPWAVFDPSPEASETFCREAETDFLARRELPMLLFERTSGELVGASGLHRLDWSTPKAEIGFWCRQRFHGQGYITEATRTLSRFAFDVLGMKRLTALPDALNNASIRVCERSGFTLEGIMRNERVTPDGTLCDTCLFALLPP